MFLVPLSFFIPAASDMLSRMSEAAGCNHMLAEYKGKWKSALEQNRGVCYNRRDIL